MQNHPQSSTPQRRLEVLQETALLLLEQLVPVVLLCPGRKVPLARKPSTPPWGEVVVLWEPEQMACIPSVCAHLGPINLGMYVGPQKRSLLAHVDMDGAEGVVKAKEMGVTHDDSAWIVRTGRGNWGVTYRHSYELNLERETRAGHLPLDLLVNGYVVIPPSDTSKEPDGGGPYSWLPGHSPFDIPLAELSEPPIPLLDWWLSLGLPPKGSSPQLDAASKGTAWRLLDSTIPEGRRNDSLARIAGWLRLYHPAPVVEALLLAVNDARCRPPLSGREVEAIVRSVSKYPQLGVNGHPRALVNPWQTEATR